jgi:hypothetical protein
MQKVFVEIQQNHEFLKRWYHCSNSNEEAEAPEPKVSEAKPSEDEAVGPSLGKISKPGLRQYKTVSPEVSPTDLSKLKKYKTTSSPDVKAPSFFESGDSVL